MSRPRKFTAAQQASILADRSGLVHVTNGPKDDLEWIGAYRLGGGSYGEVSMWICIDKNTRRPIENCAIKDTFDKNPTQEKDAYSNVYSTLVRKGMDFGVDLWATERGHANIDRRFLKEAYLQGIMTEPYSNEEIYSVPLWGYRRKRVSVRPEYNQWRLYMPFYEYGDLYHLIVAHGQKQRGIPEPFIWHTLHCLLTGAEQLTEQVRKRPGSDESDVIVVFDMKPDNILLARPNQTSTFPIYPRAHIADLGGACITNPKDRKNRTGNLAYQMTRGYCPPEVIRPSVFGHEHERYPISEWTNVWQIGRVIEAMMKLAKHFNDLSYRGSDLEPNIQNWNGQLPGQFYSWQLREAVASCLRFRPDHRATARQLLDMIDHNPMWRCFSHNMRNFGSDAWFEEQERQQAKHAATAPPASTTSPTASETAAADAASTKKRKRMEDANLYARAWDADKAAKFFHLGVFPEERYDLEYPGKGGFWATDDLPVIDSHGRYLKPLDYELEGHTASIGFSKLRIGTAELGTSTRATKWDSDVVMEDAPDEDDDGEDDDDDDDNGGEDDDHGDHGDHGVHGAYPKTSSDAPPWLLPPEGSEAVDDQGEGDEDEDDDDEGDDDEGDDDPDAMFHYHSSDFPELPIPPTTSSGYDYHSSDFPGLPIPPSLGGLVDTEGDEHEDDGGSVYYTVPSGREDLEDQEDDDEDEDTDDGVFYTAPGHPSWLPAPGYGLEYFDDVDDYDSDDDEEDDDPEDYDPDDDPAEWLSGKL